MNKRNKPDEDSLDQPSITEYFQSDVNINERTNSCECEDKFKNINLKFSVIIEKLNKLEQLDLISSSLLEIQNTLDEHQKTISTLNKENEELKKEVRQLRNDSNSVRKELNKLEQYTRRENIRVFGFEEEQNETIATCEEKFISTMKEKLNIKITKDAIDAIHRVGKVSRSRERAVVVRFSSRKTKETIMKARRQLKGSGITISHDLTKKNVQLQAHVKSLPNIETTWPTDTYLGVKDKRGGITHLSWDNSIEEAKGKLQEISSKNNNKSPNDIARQSNRGGQRIRHASPRPTSHSTPNAGKRR